MPDSIGSLVFQGFMHARVAEKPMNEKWIQISWRVGSRLQSSLLPVHIQRDG